VCRAEECSQIGESYWHREHALPGVFVCPQHEEILSVSNIALRPQLSTRNALLPQEVTGHQGNWGLDKASMKVLAMAVLEAMKLPGESWETTSGNYLRFATEITSGRGRHRWNVDSLTLEFKHKYDSGFLERIGLPLYSVDADAWPARLVRGDLPTVLLPLRYILLWQFLKFSTESQKF
jgi:hypothetical protein